MDLLNNDLKKAVKLLETGEYTCVLCRENDVFTSKERGIKPLLELLERGVYVGFSAADKIVGKAAAHLYILMGITAVYASVMSKNAEKLLKEHNIAVRYGTLTDAIINRKGDDICPMEKAVSGIEDSATAAKNIKRTIMAKEQHYGNDKGIS